MADKASGRDFAGELAAFKEFAAGVKNDVEYTKYPDFQILVAAPYSLMKHNDFTSIQLKDAQGAGADHEKVENNLRENFGIIDSESATQVVGRSCFRGCQWQYTQFEMYDSGEFKEEVAKLRPSGQESFLKCKEFSDQFKDLLGAPGYVAWDMALGVDLLRESVFCDYFNEVTARKMMDDLMKPLLGSFHSWAEFAVSFVAGGTYSSYKNSKFDEAEAEKTFDTLLGLVRRLFEDENANVWKAFAWYKKKDYFPTLDKDNLRRLVNTEQGCFVSDRISVDGARPCYVYREEPFKNFPDSGWRFFAGDESKEYTADINNSNIFPLNVIANFDESIIPLLDAEVNTAFIRKEGEEFINFKTVSDAMKEKSRENNGMMN